jgi:hypothetical protein
VLLAGSGACHTTVEAGHVLTPVGERVIRDYQPRAPLEVVVPVGPGRGADATLVRVLPSAEAVVRVTKNGGELTVPAAAIRQIDVTDHASGAAKGAGVGFLAGAAVGAFAGAQVGSSNQGDTGGGFGRAFTMTLGAVVLGLVGTLVGVMVGGTRGDVTTYHFD